MLRSGLSLTRIITSLFRSRWLRTSVVDCLVGRGPEIAGDARWHRRSPGSLGQEDRGHVFAGIRAPRGAQAAVPAVATDRRRDVLAPGDDGRAEPPPNVVEIAGKQARYGFLRRGQVIRRHRLDRGPRQETSATGDVRDRRRPRQETSAAVSALV